MQPTLVLSAPHPGVVYIDGRFAGEISGDRPLLRPVGSQGPVYLEYRPLSNDCRAMARRLVFSGGEPMAESAGAAENLNIILWPGNVVEIEFSPRREREGDARTRLAGHSFLLEEADMRLYCDGRFLATLPEGAQLPEYRAAEGGAMLTGRWEGGFYLLATDGEFQRQTGFLRARNLEFEADGRIRVVATPPDLVGHATLEIWRLTPEGLMLVSSEPAWAHGAPRWPRTPEETARAAVEAAILGLDAEAEGYLAPALRARAPLRNLRERCDLCVEMKYAPPQARPCVGLLTLEGEALARVRPLYFRAAPSGGPQGPYQIEVLEFA